LLDGAKGKLLIPVGIVDWYTDTKGQNFHLLPLAEKGLYVESTKKFRLRAPEKLKIEFITK